MTEQSGNLQKVETLMNQGRYDEAFDMCSELLADSSVENEEIYRLRARGYARRGDYLRAVHDFDQIFMTGHGQLSDYYLAAYNALYLREYDRSEGWFQKVLNEGDEKGETWFRSAVFFYLSFLRMESGYYDEAIKYLETSDPDRSDVALPLPDVEMCSRSQLRAEIERRQSLSGR